MHEIKKCCSNCKYFRHYYLNKGNRFAPTCTGQCRNESLPRKLTNKLLIETYLCECWEKDDNEKEEKVKAIEWTLRSIAKNLDIIAQALNVDL